MKRTSSLLLGPVWLAASCTVGPDYRPPPALTGPGAVPPLVGARDPAFTGEQPPGDWWRLYQDPALDALIRKALVHNADLRSMLATLEAAQAGLRATELQRTPQTGFTARATYGQASGDASGSPTAPKPGPVYLLSEAVSYDADLFGRLKRAVQAGAADVEETRAALDLARVNVVAQVASAYAGACAAGNQIAVTNRSIALARDVLSVVDRRFRGGIAGSNDVVRARTLLAQVRAALPAYLASRRGSLFLLATLTGDPPEAVPTVAERCVAAPVIRRPVPVGDGAALIRRRPDVRQAERRLAGSVAEIGVATAALYPSITLGGGLGSTATRLGDIVRDRAFTWSVGPLISWSIPNLAIGRARVRQANALARSNLAAFDGVVLVSLRETETALSALARQLDAERGLAEARDDAALAVRNTRRLYRGGVGEFLDTLDAERTLIEAETQLADATAQVAQRQVQLFLALGGGWQDAPLPDRTLLDDVVSPDRHTATCVRGPSAVVAKDDPSR